MKIEKINENQIKLILNQADLVERNIKLEDLSSPSTRIQNLFRDMMEQAFTECDFMSEGTPLMVEAMPVGMDSIMIIITKIDNTDKFDGIDFFSQSRELRRFKKKPITPFEPEVVNQSDLLIYSFRQLDDIIDLSVRLSDVFHGNSAVYKYNDRYYLILQNDQPTDHVKIETLDMVMGEYGQKHVSSLLSKYYLIEHATPILARNAVKALAKVFTEQQ